MMAPSYEAYPTVIDVRSYGVAGDGVTDCYSGLKRLVDDLPKENLVIHFPPGHYKINQYRDEKGELGIDNITFTDYKNILITGYGAKIEMTGDFLRTLDFPESGSSGVNAVIPFDMMHCSHFIIEGFEIFGNVSSIRHETGVVVEGDAHGIKTSNCSDYTIRDVYVHHCQTDGILLGYPHGESPYPADRNACLERVISSFNARQGLSVIHLAGGIFTGCTFSDTGMAPGTTTFYLPGSGVDIEPYNTNVADETGDLLFSGCTFRNNKRLQFIGVWALPTTSPIGAVTLRDCVIDEGTEDSFNKIHTVQLQCRYGVIEGCRIKGFQVTYAQASAFDPGDQHLVVRNNYIRTGGTGIYNEGAGTSHIEGNHVTSTQSTLLRRCPDLSSASTVFLNNRVFVPKEAKTVAGLVQISRMLGARSAGNTYASDLAPTTSTLDGEVLVNQTTPITLMSGTLFYQPVDGAPGLVKIGDELISYTAISGGVLSGIGRGQNGTTAAGHPSGAPVTDMKSCFTLGHDAANGRIVEDSFSGMRPGNVTGHDLSYPLTTLASSGGVTHFIDGSTTLIPTVGRYLISLDILDTPTSAPTLELPSGRDGELLILKCNSLVAGKVFALQNTASVVLRDDWTVSALGITLTLVAHGAKWFEVARSGGGN